MNPAIDLRHGKIVDFEEKGKYYAKDSVYFAKRNPMSNNVVKINFGKFSLPPGT